MDVRSMDTVHTSSSVRFCAVFSLTGIAGFSGVLPFFGFLEAAWGSNFVRGIPESNRSFINVSIGIPSSNFDLGLLFRVMQKYWHHWDIVDGMLLSCIRWCRPAAAVHTEVGV